MPISRTHALISLVIIFVLSVLTVSAATPTPLTAQTQYASWIWSPDTLFTNAYETNWSIDTTTTLWKFILEEEFTDLYVQYDSDLFNSDSIERLKRLVKTCSDNNISFHMLDGAQYMYDTSHEHFTYYLSLVEFLQHYYDTVIANQTNVEMYAITGLHLDCEPWSTKEWANNYESVVQKWQTLQLTARAAAHKMNMVYGSDIPAWFNVKTFKNNQYGEGQLDQWLIQHVDLLVLMAYSNQYTRSISGTQDEINFSSQKLSEQYSISCKNTNINTVSYNNAHGRYQRANGCAGIVIAIETIDIPPEDGAVLTFFGEHRDKVDEAFIKFNNHYSSQSGYAGYAVHYVNTLSTMTGSYPRSPQTKCQDITCPQNASCRNGMCACNTGFSGDSECLTVPTCSESCGTNGLCNLGQCTCKAGMTGYPDCISYSEAANQNNTTPVFSAGIVFVFVLLANLVMFW